MTFTGEIVMTVHISHMLYDFQFFVFQPSLTYYSALKRKVAIFDVIGPYE